MILKEEKDLLDVVFAKHKKQIIFLFYYTDITKVLLYGRRYIEKLRGALSFFEMQPNLYVIWNSNLVSSSENEKSLSIMYDYKYCRKIIELFENYENIFCAPFQIDHDLLNKIDLDFFYGDYSKCMFSFLLQNKPVLIQNLDIKNKEQHDYVDYIKLESFIKVGNEIFFSSSEGNALYKGNLKTTEITIVNYFSKEIENQSCLYTDCVQYMDKIIFAPGKAENIAIYDINKKVIETIELPSINFPYKDRIKFSSLFIYGDFIYFLPNRWPIIIKLNIKNYEIKYFQEWYTEFVDELLFPDDILFLGDYEIVNDNCFVPFCQLNMVLQLNLKNDKVVFHKIGKEKTFFSTLSYANGNFWITGGMNYIINWNEETGEIKKYEYPEEFDAGHNPFIKSFYYNGKIIVLPGTANMNIVIDTIKEKVIEFKIEKIPTQRVKIRNKYCVRKDEEGLYISRLLDGKVIVLNCNLTNIKEFNFELPSDCQNTCVRLKELYVNKYPKSYEKVEEEHQIGLLIKSFLGKEATKIQLRPRIGKEIYEVVKKSY